MFGEIPVFESLLATKLVSGRAYPAKKWHRHAGCYPRRMQKKWAARYGAPVYGPAVLYMRLGGERFIVHPSLMPRLREAIEQEGQ